MRPFLIINSFMGGDLVLILLLTTKYSEIYDRFLFKLDVNIGLKYESYIR